MSTKDVDSILSGNTSKGLGRWVVLAGWCCCRIIALGEISKIRRSQEERKMRGARSQDERKVRQKKEEEDKKKRQNKLGKRQKKHEEERESPLKRIIPFKSESIGNAKEA
ncbi:hypothetical protein CIPAW_07G212700 [Carya illinoinensis]|uniref:Uncharacterized protein n=1 Tax=Carya illinoinensis TaxID=32201 RepID=A0A8T1PYU0_CARIL|nr:hypothetical protein CIPAW_07G212700 [Carya illinoinensis]